MAFGVFLLFRDCGPFRWTALLVREAQEDKTSLVDLRRRETEFFVGEASQSSCSQTR